MLHDVFKFTFNSNVQETAIVNDFFYVDNNASSPRLDTTAAASDFFSALSALMVPATSTVQFCNSVRCEVLAGPNAGDVGVFNAITPPAGDIAGDVLPSEVAISIFRNCGRKGPKNRGRIFFGAVTQDKVSTDGNGEVTTTDATLTPIRDFLKAVFTTATVNLDPVICNHLGVIAGPVINIGINPVVVHRKSRRIRFPS